MSCLSKYVELRDSVASLSLSSPYAVNRIVLISG